MKLIPLKYNLRNVDERRLRTLLTALGIGMVVFISVLMAAFARGMTRSLRNSATADNVIIVNANAESDITRSRLEKGHVDSLIAGVSGAKEEHRQRLISPEMPIGAQIALAEDGHTHLGLLRGVRPVAFRVHPQVEITAGRESAHGNKIMVGALAATKMGVDPRELYIGRKLYMESQEWEIVGFFTAPGTVFESEIWCDVDDLISASKREQYSAVFITLESPESYTDVEDFCKTWREFEMQVWREEKFYGVVARTLRPMTYLIGAMVALVSVGGMLAGMNTLYAAALGRTREFGTLRVLGFSRLSIMAGLCVESVCIAGLGGLGGALLSQLANGLSLRFPMGAFSFEIDIELMALGVAQALVIGFLGALAPGWRCVRMHLVDTLRAF